MKAIDSSIPWGRPSEDLLTQHRLAATHKIHLTRLSNTQSTIDTRSTSSSSSSNDMSFLKTRMKMMAMKEERLRIVSVENGVLMEKIGRIMSSSGGSGSIPKKVYNPNTSPSKTKTKPKPLNKGEAYYSLTSSSSQTKHMSSTQQRISTENSRLKDRLQPNSRSIQSFYSAKKMREDEVKRGAWIRNISKTFKREVRVGKSLAKEKSMEEVERLRLLNLNRDYDYDEKNYGDDYHGDNYEEDNYDKGRGKPNQLAIHTARQIREDVATQRGLPLPSLMSLRPVDDYDNAQDADRGRGRGRGQFKGMPLLNMPSVGSSGRRSKEKFVLTHTGNTDSNTSASASASAASSSRRYASSKRDRMNNNNNNNNNSITEGDEFEHENEEEGEGESEGQGEYFLYDNVGGYLDDDIINPPDTADSDANYNNNDNNSNNYDNGSISSVGVGEGFSNYSDKNEGENENDNESDWEGYDYASGDNGKFQGRGFSPAVGGVGMGGDLGDYDDNGVIEEDGSRV